MAARERHVGRIVGRAYGYRPKRSAGKAVSAVHRFWLRERLVVRAVKDGHRNQKIGTGEQLSAMGPGD